MSSHLCRPRKSIFTHVTESQHLRGLLPTSESQYYAEWELSRGLYPLMGLRNSWEWTVAPENIDVVGPRDGGQLLDEVGFISDMDYMSDGKTLVACSSNSSIYVFEPNYGRLRHRVDNAHGDAITRVKCLGDTFFLTGSADCTVSLWDLRKTVKAVNVLSGHSKPIRSLNFNSKTNMIVSSAQDGEVRYWSFPYFKMARDEETQPPQPLQLQPEVDLSEYVGKLFVCQNLNQLCASDKKLVFTNSHGNIFIIDNLNLMSLKQDLRNLRFDDSIKLQLGWFNPNSALDKRNRIRVVDFDEYAPVPRAVISNITYMALHPTLPLLIMRLTTSVKNYHQQQVQDWTCICNVEQERCMDTLKYWHSMSNYGSNIIEEILLFGTEETRYASFREKRPSFSKCGRVLASPDKHGVRLLAFSQDLDTCDSVQLKTRQRTTSLFSMFESQEFWPSGPTQLAIVGKMERSPNSTLCCKFSPIDMLLAVGDTNSQISFYQPTL